MSAEERTMPQFPSSAWIDAFCDRLESHEAAGEVARVLDGVYRFVIEPAGPVSDLHVYDVEIRPDGNGGAAATRRNGAGPGAADALDGEHAPRLTLSAKYDRWRQLITGELDVGMALMLRRLKVSGDLGTLIRDAGTARPLVDALRGVDTDWPESG
jgi:hypothetical protein